MATDTSFGSASSRALVPSIMSAFASNEEYYVSEIGDRQPIGRTVRTDTPVIVSRIWGEDRSQRAVFSGVSPIYSPLSADAHRIDVNVVYIGAANSGIPATGTYFPRFGITSQAVSDTVMKIGAGIMAASLSVTTPISGPIETHFAGLDCGNVNSYQFAWVGNGTSHWKIFSRTAERFARTLKQMVRVEPVVDGYDHPAEAFLRESFTLEPEVATQWFWSALRENLAPSLVADSFRLLGRFTPADRDWRSQIAAEGLRSRSTDVRDAAMQAIESWGDPALAGLLKDHRQQESAKWLRDYADQIIQDLMG